MNAASPSSFVRGLELARDWTYHDGPPDRIDEVFEWATKARRLHEAAYSMDAAQRRNGLLEVDGVLRTMRPEFAPGPELDTQLVPTTLLHLVFFAMGGLYRNQPPLICAEAVSGSCANALPIYEGPGRPRRYCSDKCASRARSRRRRRTRAT